jgi:hypothetical protein
MRASISSDFARFLIIPHAQWTPSNFPDLDFGKAGEWVRSFSELLKNSEKGIWVVERGFGILAISNS